MGTLSLDQSLEPVGDLVEALVAGRLGHTGVHVGVLVGLTGDGRLQIVAGSADGQPRGRVTGSLQVFEMTVGMAGLTLGGGTEK